MAAMSIEQHRHKLAMSRQDRVIGTGLLVAGILVSGFALAQIGGAGVRIAQVAPNPSQAPVGRDTAPAESMPGGTRPTTPAPEPARPQAAPGETTGSGPPATQDRPPVTGTNPLPPAPAEQLGEPLKTK